MKFVPLIFASLICTFSVIALAYAQVDLGRTPRGDEGVIIGLSSLTNSTYGEMYVFNESGHAIDIPTHEVWYNVTNFTSGNLHNVDFSSDRFLIIERAGIYRIDYSISFAGGGNNLYGVSALINGEPIQDAYINRKLGAGGDVGNAGGTAILKLNVDDVIALGIEDETNPASDATIYMANLNVIKLEVTDTVTIINNTGGGGGSSGNIFDQDLNTTNNVTFSNVTVNHLLYLAEGFKHLGDDNTEIELADDRMLIKAGGKIFMDLIEAAGFGFLYFNPNTQDIDFIFEGDTDTNLLYVNAGLDAVGIGEANPTEKLEVSGNVTADAYLGDGTFLDNVCLTDGTNCNFTDNINITSRVTYWAEENAALGGGYEWSYGNGATGSDIGIFTTRSGTLTGVSMSCTTSPSTNFANVTIRLDGADTSCAVVLPLVPSANQNRSECNVPYSAGQMMTPFTKQGGGASNCVVFWGAEEVVELNDVTINPRDKVSTTYQIKKAGTVDGYFGLDGVTCSSSGCLTAHNDGSIIGIQVLQSAGINIGSDIRVEVRINGVTQDYITPYEVGFGGSFPATTNTTYSVGTYPFNEGDSLQFYYNYVSGGGTPSLVPTLLYEYNE